MNLVLITSVINISSNKLSYSYTRSFCDKERRFSDTLKTIDSISSRIPSSIILLVECSDLDEDIESELKKQSDYYINYNKDDSVRTNVDSASKALGEATLTYKAIEFIMVYNINYRNFFKISGRYWLNDKFDYSIYDNDKIVVRYINGNKYIISTLLFKIPKRIVDSFREYLRELISHNCGEGFELLFATFINNLDEDKITFDRMGINGYISVNGQYIDI